MSAQMFLVFEIWRFSVIFFNFFKKKNLDVKKN